MHSIFKRYPLQKAFNIFLTLGLIISIVVNIIITFQFPIYTDDVGFLILGTRFFQDGIIRPSLFPECANAGLGTPTPWPLIPGLIINSLYFGWINAPVELRIFSIIQYFTWIVIVFFIRKLSQPEEKTFYRLAYFFIPLSGTIPIILTMARPEQTIAVILSLVVLMSMIKHESKLSTLYKSCFFLFPSWLAILHPKSFFFFPLLAYSSLSIFRKKTSKILFGSWLGLIILYGYPFYNKALSCKENPKIQETLSTINQLLNINSIFSNPLDFISQGSINITRQIAGIFHYVPSWKIWTRNFEYLGANFLLHKVLITLILLILLYSPFKLIFRRIFSKTSGSKNFNLCYILVFCTFGYYFFQNWYCFYYSAFSFFLVFTYSVIVIPKLEFKKNNVLILLMLNAILTSIVSLSWLTSRETYTISTQWKELIIKPYSGYFATALQTESDNTEIINSANKCGISTLAQDRLIIDESTYFAFRENKLPIMSQYTWGGFRKEIADINLPQEFGAFTGIITRCSRLPEQIKKETIQTGDYCCKSLKTSP